MMQSSEAQADPELQMAIDRFFNGSKTMYTAFRQSCLAQFPRDTEAFDRAELSEDQAAMRRIAHNLHAALNMLGCSIQKQLARDIELAAAMGAMVDVRCAWSVLREELFSLVKLG
jgi:HPt (histidine-containing phosphotransfer) domain-containing protein